MARRTAAIANPAPTYPPMPKPLHKPSSERVQRWPEPNLCLERGTAGGQQMVAGITPTVVLHGVVRAGRLFRRQNGGSGDVEFRAVCAARQFLDGASVEIARGKIHVVKRASFAEHAIDQADTLEQFRPIDVGNQAQAGDDVTYRNGSGTLPLVLVADHRVRGRSSHRELFVEPCQRGGDPWILVAQPVHQLDGKCVR